jgi:molybdate transport system substrate-binding protein
MRWKGLTAALLLLAVNPAQAQVKVLMSGGLAAAYQRMLPEFERTTGLHVETATGASQGASPDTIGRQLQRGVVADLVIMSREGLADLVTEGRLIAATVVELAQTPVGVAVRAGVPKPDISNIEAFKQALLRAKLIALPGSTSGIYLTKTAFPRLGLAGKIKTRTLARGSEVAALVVSGEADMGLLPVSELLPVAGLQMVGKAPAEVQFMTVFGAAVVKGTKQADAAQKLIAFLASGKLDAAIRDSGMERPAKR